MAKSTRTSPADKPEKPYADFPLFPHATRRWAKKIRGQLKYFGPWTDDEDRGAMAALAKYQEQATDLHAGRTPRPTGDDGATVKFLLDSFMTAKKHLFESGEIVQRTYDDYYATCKLIVEAFGRKRPLTDIDAEDFRLLRKSLAKRLGPVALGNTIQRVRSVFKFGYDEGILDRPVRYGQGFARPKRRVLRKARAQNGQKMFEAWEIGLLLAEASPQLKAMICLGVNCGFGNADCGKLPLKAVDLDAGWIDFPRPKTGIGRRCPLWPETVGAIRAAIAKRPTPKDAGDKHLLFVTKYGGSWHKEDGSDSPITKEFTKLLRALRCPRCHSPKEEDAKKCEAEACGWKPTKAEPWATLTRKGRGFYALRHTCETIGGESIDQAAVDHIMGHSRDDMASVYRERISDDRLQAVTDHVRGWLFPQTKTK